MSQTIFWKDNQVVIMSRCWQEEAGKYDLCNCPCIDTVHEHGIGRYGQFRQGPGSGWEHIPLEKFPPEFRVQLLLLGIS